MPDYDAINFEPPAPVAYVTLRNPATGKVLTDVPLLIDTGADATILPQSVIEHLALKSPSNTSIEVQGFGGGSQQLSLVKLELYFLDKKFTGEFLVADRPTGILGRNVLNNLRIFLDGPQGTWGELTNK